MSGTVGHPPDQPGRCGLGPGLAPAVVPAEQPGRRRDRVGVFRISPRAQTRWSAPHLEAIAESIAGRLDRSHGQTRVDEDRAEQGRSAGPELVPAQPDLGAHLGFLKDHGIHRDDSGQGIEDRERIARGRPGTRCRRGGVVVHADRALDLEDAGRPPFQHQVPDLGASGSRAERCQQLSYEAFDRSVVSNGAAGQVDVARPVVNPLGLSRALGTIETGFTSERLELRHGGFRRS
jgi:hypothetical protein